MLAAFNWLTTKCFQPRGNLCDVNLHHEPYHERYMRVFRMTSGEDVGPAGAVVTDESSMQPVFTTSSDPSNMLYLGEAAVQVDSSIRLTLG